MTERQINTKTGDGFDRTIVSAPREKRDPIVLAFLALFAVVWLSLGALAIVVAADGPMVCTEPTGSCQ